METTNMGRAREIFAKPNFGLNCLELFLGALSVAGYMYWYRDPGSLFTKIFGLQFGFVVLTMLIIIGHVMDLPMHRNLLLTCTILGSIVWITTAIFLIAMYVLEAVFNPLNVFFISAMATFNNAVVHLIDAVKLCNCSCSCCKRNEDYHEEMVPTDSKNFHAVIVPSDVCVKN